MSAHTGGPRVWSRAALRYHLVFGAAVCVCLAAGWFELGRAREGREIAWVYTVEWPFFAVLLAVMWWHVVHDGATRRPSPRSARPTDRDISDDDPGLQAWRAYLVELGHDDGSTDTAPGSG